MCVCVCPRVFVMCVLSDVCSDATMLSVLDEDEEPKMAQRHDVIYHPVMTPTSG